jgi:galactokinase
MRVSSSAAFGPLARIVGTATPQGTQADALLARLNHFVAENGQILPAAGDALARGDLGALGDLVDRSQEAAERLLGNQVPETSCLARVARRCGAVAASAFGAGFGGSVWALVETGRTGSFLNEWAAAYRIEFPQHAATSSFFVAGAGPAAFQVG